MPSRPPRCSSEVDIIRLLEETLSATEERYREEGYHFVRDFPPAVPLFEADPSQIRQIFMNIFLNSFKAMPDGGTIAITIRAEKEPEKLKINKRFISIRNPFTVARDWLIISIKDEGCGIPENIWARSWSPSSVSATTASASACPSSPSWSGCTAAIFEIESTEGGGTTFRLFFPAY